MSISKRAVPLWAVLATALSAVFIAIAQIAPTTFTIVAKPAYARFVEDARIRVVDLGYMSATRSASASLSSEDSLPAGMKYKAEILACYGEDQDLALLATVYLDQGAADSADVES